MTDYALVVGVARYPELAAGGFGNLNGPDNDAQAVYDWLIDGEGGGLDPANVRIIRSADFAVDSENPEPASYRIERDLKWLAAQTEAMPGRRLYLYFSGHGFAPRLEEGALFTADATMASPEHVYAHAWLRWFRTARRFHESVLWMDSCMNYQQSIPVNEVMMRIKPGTGVPGPAFVALAAQTRSAVESEMSDGKPHGVFTWALLKGLRGGACDERGRVTGESLRTFLYNVMPDFMPADARRVAAIDLQPFVRADPGMLFRRMETVPTYPVRLTAPAAATGNEMRIWTGRPHRSVESATLTDAGWSGDLVRGLYVAEISGARLRQGFQVNGAGPVEVTIDQPGPAVVGPDQQDLFELEVLPDNKAADVTVTDYRFEDIVTATGELHERDTAGVYKIRTQIGRDITTASDEVILLDRDTVIGSLAPTLSSPAPIPGTALTHENHVEPFLDAAGRHGEFTPLTSGESAISVMARYWTIAPGNGAAVPELPHPMSGLTLVDADGALIADLMDGCQVADRSGADPVAVWERKLAPGHYFLRQDLPDGRVLEGCLTASRNWVTQVALQRAGREPADGQAAPIGAVGDASLFMRSSDGGSRPPDQDAVVEATRLALAQGRNPFGEGKGLALQQLLLETYDDPVAVIIGAHLLLRSINPGEPDPEKALVFNGAVTKLRDLLGRDHPDVEALSLRAADPALRATKPFAVPPIFTASWELIADASYGRPSFVQPELWERVHAASAVGPFFVWAVDEATRAAHREQLARWIAEHARAERRADLPVPPAAIAPSRPGDVVPRQSAPPGADLPASAREAAHAIHLPSAAAAELWENR